MRDYQKDLIKHLKNKDEATAYLNAALEDGDAQVLIIAFRNVLEAQGNVADFAKKCKIPRSSIYKMTSKHGNPSITNILKMIKCIGINLKFENNKSSKLAHA